MLQLACQCPSPAGQGIWLGMVFRIGPQRVIEMPTVHWEEAMKPDFWPNPLIWIDFSIEIGQTTFEMDRSCQRGHFGLCIFLNEWIFCPNTCWDVDFLYFPNEKNGSHLFWRRRLNKIVYAARYRRHCGSHTTTATVHVFGGLFVWVIVRLGKITSRNVRKFEYWE